MVTTTTRSSDSLQRPQGPRDASPAAGREAVRADEAVEIFDSGDRQLDARHDLQIVQRHGLAGFGLLKTELRALVRSGLNVV